MSRTGFIGTFIGDQSQDVSANAITGTVAPGHGGTGQTAITVNGSILIGNTVSHGYDLNPITPGTNITVLNDKGSITISSSDAFAQAQANAAFAKANIATTNADAAFAQANAAYANANTAIYTATQIRANISNTAPINYAPSTGVISHADSGASASGYGDAATVPKVVVDAKGHVTSVTNTSIAIATTQVTSGILSVARGGTGKDATGLANGQLLIGNTVNTGFDLTTIAQTAPVIVVNGKGTITLSHASSGVTATGYGTAAIVPVFVVDAFGHVTSVTNTTIAITTSQVSESAGGPFFHTAARVRGNVSNTAPINYDATTGIFSHALSGAAAAGYGDAATVPKVVVDTFGHVTSVTNTAIAISTTQITSGILSVARGGTGKDATGLANGQLLIGNTVNTGFDLTTIAQTAPVIVVNGKGTITLSHASSGVTATGYGTAAAVPVFVVDAFGHVTSVTNTTIAITTSQVSESAGGPFYFTAARVRGNVSNTAPINYDSTTGIFSHALSGAAAAGYGDAATVPKVVVDTFGHVTSVTNTAIAIATTQITSGILSVARGGTGKDATGLANGQLLIGNTVNTGFDLTTIAQTAPVIVVNGKGTITLSHASSGVTATGYGTAAAVPVFVVDAFGHVTSVTNTTIAITSSQVSESAGGPFFFTAARVRANVSNTAPINYDSTTGIFSHALSGVTAAGYGDAATVPKVVVDTFGHVTSVTNTAIAISAAAITSGTLVVGRGGTGQTAASLVNGAVLIGNTVSGGYDLNTITQGTGIVITNDKGSILIAATGGAATDQFARDKANGAVQTGFVTINVAGQSDIVADSNVDTLTIVAGSGIVVTTNATTDTLTITGSGSGMPTGNSVVGDTVFYENSQNVTGNYTITAGKSAMSTGPVTVNPGIIVTVPAGSRWVVI